MKVVITPEAREDFAALPVVIQERVRDLTQRLLDWPAVSGAKPLRKEWKGCYRLRTGDWRLIIRPTGNEIRIIRISNRRDVYED